MISTVIDTLSNQAVILFLQKIDIPLKDSTSGQMRVVSQVEKTLWTCAVESAFEFHRIVDEIYPDGVRLMRFVISDFVGRFLTPNWGTQLISLDQVHILSQNSY